MESIPDTKGEDYTKTIHDMVDLIDEGVITKFNAVTGSYEVMDEIKDGDNNVEKLVKRYDDSQAEKKAEREAKLKLAQDIFTQMKAAIKSIGEVANDSGSELLQGMGLMKKPDIFKLILLLDSSLAQFLKKPVNAGVDVQRQISQMGEVADSSVTGITGDPYEDCLEEGDPVYDANDPEKNPGAATGAISGDSAAYGIGKAFIDLGKEKFDYQFEDVCFQVDKIKLEVFLSTNRDFKFELFNLLDTLTGYNILSDKSLQFYMQSALDDDNEPTDSEKKKQKEIEEKDTEKAVKKDKENTEIIKKAKEETDNIYIEIDKLNGDDEKRKAFKKKYKELTEKEKNENNKSEKKKLSLILGEMLAGKLGKNINDDYDDDDNDDSAQEAPSEPETTTGGGGKSKKTKKAAKMKKLKRKKTRKKLNCIPVSI